MELLCSRCRGMCPLLAAPPPPAHPASPARRPSCCCTWCCCGTGCRCCAWARGWPRTPRTSACSSLSPTCNWGRRPASPALHSGWPAPGCGLGTSWGRTTQVRGGGLVRGTWALAAAGAAAAALLPLLLLGAAVGCCRSCCPAAAAAGCRRRLQALARLSTPPPCPCLPARPPCRCSGVHCGLPAAHHLAGALCILPGHERRQRGAAGGERGAAAVAGGRGAVADQSLPLASVPASGRHNGETSPWRPQQPSSPPFCPITCCRRAVIPTLWPAAAAAAACYSAPPAGGLRRRRLAVASGVASCCASSTRSGGQGGREGGGMGRERAERPAHVGTREASWPRRWALLVQHRFGAVLPA